MEPGRINTTTPENEMINPKRLVKTEPQDEGSQVQPERSNSNANESCSNRPTIDSLRHDQWSDVKPQVTSYLHNLQRDTTPDVEVTLHRECQHDENMHSEQSPSVLGGLVSKQEPNDEAPSSTLNKQMPQSHAEKLEIKEEAKEETMEEFWDGCYNENQMSSQDHLSELLTMIKDARTPELEQHRLELPAQSLGDVKPQLQDLWPSLPEHTQCNPDVKSEMYVLKEEPVEDETMVAGSAEDEDRKLTGTLGHRSEFLLQMLRDAIIKSEGVRHQSRLPCSGEVPSSSSDPSGIRLDSDQFSSEVSMKVEPVEDISDSTFHPTSTSGQISENEELFIQQLSSNPACVQEGARPSPVLLFANCSETSESTDKGCFERMQREETTSEIDILSEMDDRNDKTLPAEVHTTFKRYSTLWKNWASNPTQHGAFKKPKTDSFISELLETLKSCPAPKKTHTSKKTKGCKRSKTSDGSEKSKNCKRSKTCEESDKGKVRKTSKKSEKNGHAPASGGLPASASTEGGQIGGTTPSLAVKRPPQYPCEFCGKAFVIRKNLTRHLESSTSKEYKCMLCWEAIPAKCSYQQHMAKHLNAARDESNQAKTRVGDRDEFNQAKVRVGGRDELNQVKAQVADRDEFNQAKAQVAGRDAFNQAKVRVGGRDEFNQAKVRVADRDELNQAKTRVADRDELNQAKIRVADRDEFNQAKERVAGRDEFNQAKTQVADRDELNQVKAQVADRDESNQAKVQVADRDESNQAKVRVADRDESDQAKERVVGRDEANQVKARTYRKIPPVLATVEACEGTQETYKCPLCVVSFRSMKCLFSHLDFSSHQKRNTHVMFRCHACKKTFLKSKELLLHITVVHKDRPVCELGGGVLFAPEGKVGKSQEHVAGHKDKQSVQFEESLPMCKVLEIDDQINIGHSYQHKELSSEPGDVQRNTKHSFQSKELSSKTGDLQRNTEHSYQSNKLSSEPGDAQRNKVYLYQYKAVSSKAGDAQRNRKHSYQFKKSTPEPGNVQRNTELSYQSKELSSEPGDAQGNIEHSYQSKELSSELGGVQRNTEHSYQSKELSFEPGDAQRNTEHSYHVQSNTDHTYVCYKKAYSDKLTRPQILANFEVVCIEVKLGEHFGDKRVRPYLHLTMVKLRDLIVDVAQARRVREGCQQTILNRPFSQPARISPVKNPHERCGIEKPVKSLHKT